MPTQKIMSQGYDAGLYTYDFPGNPTDAPVSSFNPPPGALVVDTENFVLYQKTSPLGDNSGYSLSGASSGLTRVTPSTPLTGASLSFNTASLNEELYIVPAGTIAALTVVFPSDANSAIGQTLSLYSTQIVSTLTVTAAGLTLEGDAVTSLAANQPVSWTKVAASTWARNSTPSATTLTNLLSVSGAGPQINAKTDIVTPSAPVTTNSLSITTTKQNETLYIVPAGTIAALTIVFPSDANSQIGQVSQWFSTQIVSTLTVTSAGLTLLGSAVTALAANTPITYKKVAASTWARLQ